jgi:hypothetical protein
MSLLRVGWSISGSMIYGADSLGAGHLGPWGDNYRRG